MPENLTIREIIIALAICWNAAAFLIMRFDKRNAIGHRRRVPEKTLFAISFLFGGPGILAGMYAFRHKTKHTSFKILVPLGIFVDAVILMYFFPEM